MARRTSDAPPGSRGLVLGENPGVFAYLRDPAEFAKVFVHPEAGTVAWPDGLDLDPDVLYARAHSLPIPL